jgi:hypothetical protein
LDEEIAAKNDLEFDIIDPTILTDACDLCIKMLVANMGHPLWMDSNLVHLTPDGYWDLAAVISDSARAPGLRHCQPVQL